MTTEARKDHRAGLRHWLSSRTGTATLIVVVVAGVLIYMDHTAHLFGAIPYLLLLACPLMHIFRHRAHEHHHGRRSEGNRLADE